MRVSAALTPSSMTRVLIVDDEPESRARLRALLVAQGHQVSEAANGLDALVLARREPPDLVISDVLMPQMDGFALCRAHQADPTLSRTPFVFYTGSYTSAKDAAQARRLGATRFLVKSMAAEEVIRAISDVLAQAGTLHGRPMAETPAHETESYRLYNESMIARLEHRNLELADELQACRAAEGRDQALVAALDHLPMLVSLTDPHGRIVYVNRCFEAVTGFTREEVLGQTHAVLRGADAGQGFDIRARVLAGQEWRGEFEHRRKDGRPFWERVVISPVRDEAGQVTHFLRTAEDVTEARRAQAAQDEAASQARQQERLDAVGRLAGGVAHDFNNLLTIVEGHAHLVLKDLAPADPLRSDLLAIIDAANRGATITRQLLTYARRDHVHPVALDPARAIASSARALQRLAGDRIRVGYSLGPEIGPVLVDAAQFEQVLMHLVANARDAIDGGGAIDLSLANVTLTAEQARAYGLAAGRYVSLQVSDTGRGIAPDVLPRIFEPFFTTKAPGDGPGLGLSSVLGMVEQAGGYVGVERTGAHGTTMLVLWPRAAARPAAMPTGAADASLEGTERILLVEDEPAVLDLVRRTLESYGYTVVHASTPERALRAMQEGVRVDLLLTDVVMPGMNGPELARHLATIDPQMRVLFMSGYSADVAAEHGWLSGDVSLITKPFSPTALVAHVRSVLDA